MTGELRLNGRPYQSSELKKMSGYVMQEESMNPNLTARETLHYTAQLKLPASMSRAERDARVEEVVQVMGLTLCQHVIVGDPSKKGISGGERRRSESRSAQAMRARFLQCVALLAVRLGWLAISCSQFYNAPFLLYKYPWLASVELLCQAWSTVRAATARCGCP